MSTPPTNSGIRDNHHHGAVTSSDLTFITHEQGKHLADRFDVLLGDDTRFFDCLIGYFFISGFHRVHPALIKTEKIRIPVPHEFYDLLDKNLPPRKVLAVLRRDIKHEYFQASPTAHASQALAPREVILSSWLVTAGGEGGARG